VEVRPVTPDRWADLVALFERPGPRGGTPMTAGCCCMWWRRRTGGGAKNKRALGRLVREGREPGLLAYEETGRPVGWVSVAPREEYGHILGSRKYGPQEEEAGIWSIVCFYVDPRSKGRGVATALLEAAVEHAFARGAAAVESYPHDRGDYMGSPAMFEAAGFETLRSVAPRRIVRLYRRRRRRSRPKASGRTSRSGRKST
jgi:GNAT superfamily N-acetyltransferase